MNKENKKKDFKRLRENYKTNPNGSKQDKRKIATTRHLTRIMIYLSCVDYAHQTKIQKELGVENHYVKDAINFLLNHKIIFKFITQIIES